MILEEGFTSLLTLNNISISFYVITLMMIQT